MTGRRWGLVAFGGTAGAIARWATLEAWPPTEGFPWPVLVLNLLGSLVVGAVMGDGSDVGEPSTAREQGAAPVVHELVGLGFCGGLTTFSTFAVEAVVLDRAGEAATAAAYLTSSVVGAIIAVLAGAAIARSAGGPFGIRAGAHPRGEPIDGEAA
jgi:fluoride exporter